MNVEKSKWKNSCQIEGQKYKFTSENWQLNLFITLDFLVVFNNLFYLTPLNRGFLP